MIALKRSPSHKRFAVCLLLLSWVSSAGVARAQEAKPSASKGPETKEEQKPPVLERTGVVTVEQAGRVLGLGTVLGGDGRVLTAASRLSEKAGPLLVRYADGKTREARLGHADRDRDLALLVPKTLAVHKGVKASASAAPISGTSLRTFTLAGARSLSPTEFTVKSLEQSGRQLLIALDPVAKASDLGAPLFDARGRAVGILVSGCSVTPSSSPPLEATATATGTATATPASKPKADSCARPPAGLPVSTVRAFLRALPPEAQASGPWLGIDGVSTDTGVVRGIRIGTIEPKSPAAALPLQYSTDSTPGDVLVAVAGQPVPTPDALTRVLTRHAPGDRVELLVLTKDGYHTHSVRLAERPETAP